MRKSVFNFAIVLIYLSAISSAHHLDRDRNNNNINNLRTKLALRKKSNNGSIIIINNHEHEKRDGRNHDDHHRDDGHFPERLLHIEDESAIHSRIALLADCAFTNSRECHDQCQDSSSASSSSSQNTTLTTFAPGSIQEQEDEEVTCDTFDLEANAVVACCSECSPLIHDLVVGLVSVAWDLNHCSWAQALEKPSKNNPVKHNLGCDAEVNDLLAMPSLALLDNTIECLELSFRNAVDYDHSASHASAPNNTADMISSAFIGVGITVGVIVMLIVVGRIARRCRTVRKMQKVNHGEEVATI